MRQKRYGLTTVPIDIIELVSKISLKKSELHEVQETVAPNL